MANSPPFVGLAEGWSEVPTRKTDASKPESLLQQITTACGCHRTWRPWLPAGGLACPREGADPASAPGLPPSPLPVATQGLPAPLPGEGSPAGPAPRRLEGPRAEKQPRPCFWGRSWRRGLPGPDPAGHPGVAHAGTPSPFPGVPGKRSLMSWALASPRGAGCQVLSQQKGRFAGKRKNDCKYELTSALSLETKSWWQDEVIETGSLLLLESSRSLDAALAPGSCVQSSWSKKQEQLRRQGSAPGRADRASPQPVHLPNAGAP